MTIDRLREIYDDYFLDMKESGSGVRSALGNILMGSRGADSCNARFARKAEEALAAFDFERENAGELLDFVLEKGAEYRGDLRLGMMMTAVQRFLLPFTEHISAEKARSTLAWYDGCFEKRERTPVMEDFRRALQKQAEKGKDEER